MASEVKSDDESVEPVVHTPEPWKIEVHGKGYALYAIASNVAKDVDDAMDKIELKRCT